jgi:hypothetical protein
MRRAFVITSSLLLLAFSLQFVFAAVGAFSRPNDDGSYVLHSVNGTAVIPILTIVTVVFAALAKAPGRVIGLAVLPLGLVVLQMLLAALAKGLTDDSGGSTPAGLVVGGLHAINGIIAVHVVLTVTRAARRLGQPSADPAADSASGAAAPAGDVGSAVPAAGSPSSVAGFPGSAAGSPSSVAGFPGSAAGSPSSAAGLPSSVAGSAGSVGGSAGSAAGSAGSVAGSAGAAAAETPA